jgi:hypothetical protein
MQAIGTPLSSLAHRARKYLLAAALPTAAVVSGCASRGANITYPTTSPDCDATDRVEFSKVLVSERPGQFDSQAQVKNCRDELLAILSENNESFIKTTDPKINDVDLEEPNLLKFDYGNTLVEVRRLVNNPQGHDSFMFKAHAKDTGEIHTLFIK